MSTVSIDAIHSLADEMVNKVISAQKKEVDEMIKEAESYVSRLKSAMNYNNAIVGQGEINSSDGELSTIKVKRAKTTLNGVENISNIETTLAHAKKQQQIYNDLINEFKRYCSNMHGSADKIEEAMEKLVEELDPISSEDKNKTVIEDEDDEKELEDGDDEKELEDDDEVDTIGINSGVSSKMTGEDISTLKALFEEYGIPVPTDLDNILNGETTPVPTVITPSVTPTISETPPISEIEPIELPPVTNGGNSGYTSKPAVEQPPTVEAPPSIDNIVKGKISAKIPTSSAPIAKVETKAKTKTSGSTVITTTSGIATAAVIGLGAKAYLDKKQSEEEDRQAEKLLLENNNNSDSNQINS